MGATPHPQEPDALPPKIIIPVRYVHGGAVVQTTSSSLSKDLIHVRSAQPPRAGLIIGLLLYCLKVGEVVRSTGLISETTDGPQSGFWAELADDEHGAAGIADLLERYRGCSRYQTRLRARIRKEGRSADGYVTNISRSGAFVNLDWPPPAASVIDLDLSIPGGPGRESVLGFVVHAAEHKGVGVQFIGGSDEFRSRLDEYVARLGN